METDGVASVQEAKALGMARVEMGMPRGVQLAMGLAVAVRRWAE